MKRWERWTFNFATVAVALSGAAYFWMKYGVRNDDPFAVVNHPWQAAMLEIHVLASPIFILIFGVILNSHVARKLGASLLPNRRSGYASLAALGLMVCSGYLLQVAAEETWIRALVVLHVGGGASFVAVYAAHLVMSARLARRRAELSWPGATAPDTRILSARER